jgi:hypothetical protein
VHAVCSTNLMLIMSGEDYKLWSSSVNNFLQPPFASCLWGPFIPLGSLFSDTLICFSP